MYKIVGTDGKTYGPIDAGIIKQWIAENRVERQTPVHVEGAPEWTYLGLLPEFNSAFAPPPAGTAPSPVHPAQPPRMPANAIPQTSSLAVLGLICGILSLTCLCCCGGFPFNLLGIILCWLALAEINRRPETYTGQGMAVTGLVLSGISLFFCVLMFIYQLAFSSVHYSFHRL